MKKRNRFISQTKGFLSWKGIQSLRAIASVLPLSVLLLLFLMVSCNRHAEEVDRLQEENEALRSQMDQKDENIDGYFSELNQIEENLQIIKEKENIISRQAIDDVEFGVSQQDRINEDIQLIGELMEKNRMLIASLNNRLRNADTRIAGFEEMIARLNATIEEKEIEIQLLREQLGKMNLQVDFLTARVDTLEWEAQQKTRMLEQQTMEMNRAYFAIGSNRELRDQNVISREGGFLGIGRTERLSTRFNKDFFTRIDITRDFEISIHGNRPELITVHPSDSYEIKNEEGISVLHIKDPEAFWAASRYLVIQVR